MPRVEPSICAPTGQNNALKDAAAVREGGRLAAKRVRVGRVGSISKPEASTFAVPIVMCCDEGYSAPLATALRSIVEFGSTMLPFHAYVLSAGFTEVARNRVVRSLPAGSVHIHWRSIDLGSYQHFSTLPHISKMTYARFQIPQVVGEGVARVLYLDADILALDDLRALSETDLEGAVLGAVVDEGIDLRVKRGEDGCEGIPRVQDYFNAGVLLIDLQRWREQEISQRALEYLASHPQSPYSDQDALNVVCDGRWKKLAPRWNHQAHHDARLSRMPIEGRPGIVHFVMNMKPWDPRALSSNANFYDSFRNRTCFRRSPYERAADFCIHHWSRLKRRVRHLSFLRFMSS